MKIKINYKVILIIVIVAIILGGGIMLSRPIVKNVILRECHTDVNWEFPIFCDQDGDVVDTRQMSALGQEKYYFSLLVLKNRLHFVFKKYVLRVEDKELLESITKIKVFNPEDHAESF